MSFISDFVPLFLYLQKAVTKGRCTALATNSYYAMKKNRIKIIKKTSLQFKGAYCFLCNSGLQKYLNFFFFFFCRITTTKWHTIVE